MVFTVVGWCVVVVCSVGLCMLVFLVYFVPCWLSWVVCRVSFVFVVVGTGCCAWCGLSALLMSVFGCFFVGFIIS